MLLRCTSAIEMSVSSLEQYQRAAAEHCLCHLTADWNTCGTRLLASRQLVWYCAQDLINMELEVKDYSGAIACPRKLSMSKTGLLKQVLWIVVTDSNKH